MAEIRVVTPAVRRRLIEGGGTVAGVIGGLVIWALMLIMAATNGRDLWPVLKGASSPFFHRRAMMPGFDAAPVILGMIIHLAISIAWGILFALVAFGLSRAATVGLGAIWGLIVWLVMFFIVLPLVTMGGHMPRAHGMALPILQHIIFGLAVGISFLPFQRERPEHLPWWREHRV